MLLSLHAKTRFFNQIVKVMGLIGSLYHAAKGIYAMANHDSEKANEELDKAVDSLRRTE